MYYIYIYDTKLYIPFEFQELRTTIFEMSEKYNNEF